VVAAAWNGVGWTSGVHAITLFGVLMRGHYDVSSMDHLSPHFAPLTLYSNAASYATFFVSPSTVVNISADGGIASNALPPPAAAPHCVTLPSRTAATHTHSATRFGR
jgi:hypothetical protein